jgi:hypothetical protein
MISLIIAGGMYAAATMKPIDWPDINNHTLKGESILSSKVVCRDRWGTPMLPDGKGGYSLIAPINEKYIQESLIIPPWNFPKGVSAKDVVYRPLPPVNIIVEETAQPAAPSTPATPATPSTPGPSGIITPVTPVEAVLPADPSTPADAPPQ